MKICSLYGAGFYYIPGTDMCIKVGGWARFETVYNYNGSMTSEFFGPQAAAVAGNLQNRSTNDNTWRYKGTVTVDSRNQTDYGTVRSYVAIGTSNNNNGDNPAGLYANRWFIQWAGFTVGHATSFFDFYSIGANQYGFVVNSDTGDGGWDVLAYTAQFGNGVSASISAEVQRRTQIVNAGAAAAAGVALTTAVNTNYQGHDYPDIVGNLRVDQAWGSAQIMGALHNVASTYYTTTSEWTGHPGDELGYALGAGVKLNAPMVAPGDYLQAQVVYTHGASRYANHTATVWNYIAYSGNDVGIGINSDAVYGGSVAAGTASALSLTDVWSVWAAYTHFWTRSLKSTLWGSYMHVDYGSSANAMLCSAAGDGVGAGNAAVANAGCDFNWALWGAGLRTQWNVTSDFYLGLEVLYANLESYSTSTGTVGITANGTKPAATYILSDQDIWALRLRVHKDFYP